MVRRQPAWVLLCHQRVKNRRELGHQKTNQWLTGTSWQKGMVVLPMLLKLIQFSALGLWVYSPALGLFFAGCRPDMTTAVVSAQATSSTGRSPGCCASSPWFMRNRYRFFSRISFWLHAWFLCLFVHYYPCWCQIGFFL